MEAIYIRLMNGEWNQSMNNHPEVKLPLWSIWDHIGLWMYWNRFVQVNMMNTKPFKEPVTRVPMLWIPTAPGGFHGIIGIACRSGHGS
jgi:hypothetical protein